MCLRVGVFVLRGCVCDCVFVCVCLCVVVWLCCCGLLVLLCVRLCRGFVCLLVY